jgi:hypothetical protein|tara:strand:- start:476 stop:1621 length:1146 start_codon:yes stop_codon:yes gene_type:complete
MIRTFEYDLLQCEERTWHSWENFTETLTQNFQNFRKQFPDEQVKIKFNYTCEGTVILIDNKIFYQRLHEFGKKYNVKLSNITFRGSNEKIQQSYDKWHELYSDTPDKINVESECFGLFLYRKNSGYHNHLIYTKEAPEGIRSKKYNCLNGNMLPHRLMFMLSMFKENLVDTENTLTSFHAFPELLNPSPTDPVLKHQKWVDLLTNDIRNLLPLQFDITGDWQEIYDKVFEPYPAVNNLDWNKVGDFRNIYENTYFTITTEGSECQSLCDYHWEDEINDYFKTFHTEMFITEKTTRPILNLHPQIIYGATGTIEHLKSLGYKTFSDYWSEDYDNVDGEHKLESIMNVIKEMSAKSIEELHEMYWDMMPILKHNQEILLDTEI